MPTAATRSFLLAVTLTLAACSGDSQDTSGEPGDVTTPAPTTSLATQTTPAAPTTTTPPPPQPWARETELAVRACLRTRPSFALSVLRSDGDTSLARESNDLCDQAARLLELEDGVAVSTLLLNLAEIRAALALAVYNVTSGNEPTPEDFQATFTKVFTLETESLALIP
jgi:hypothetical protein